ncbi:hypothetical protein DFH07DRAFT_958622 [Mycena maculata]|uniref:Uncharacterized protein n=1 Tax=Mycena maculata TaxID=230809 RepID=A0AAD7J6F9_9AGAR|nr:hypothetical protein DFH07DRAFT_958622 [Mycena maculata]
MSYYNETAVLEPADNQYFDLGPYLTGGISLAAQIFMMGALTLQMWKYFENHDTDSKSTKILVVVLFLMSTFQAATDFCVA